MQNLSILNYTEIYFNHKETKYVYCKKVFKLPCTELDRQITCLTEKNREKNNKK